MKLLTDATLNRDATVSRSRRLDFRMKSIRAVLGRDSVAVFAASLLLGAGQLHPFATARTVTQVGLMTPNLPYNGHPNGLRSLETHIHTMPTNGKETRAEVG